MLGGALVRVSGLCFEPTDIVTCEFGDIITPGAFINQNSIACISPAMNAIGRVEVTLRITRSNAATLERSSFFHSGTYIVCTQLFMEINSLAVPT